jgi:hypothetical protein
MILRISAFYFVTKSTADAEKLEKQTLKKNQKQCADKYSSQMNKEEGIRHDVNVDKTKYVRN